ncbi:MAG: alpha/beta hydrolase [Anaerolineales bacterium]|nr:alpha/beta hydrolase [Anaerolineales bacterium]
MVTAENGERITIKPEISGRFGFNHHKLYVEIYGSLDSPAVILLHHGLGSTKSWRDQYPFFAGSGYRVIAYDRWGYGKSDPRRYFSMPSFEEDLQDLESLLDEFKINKAALLGHSDGGTIALYFAARQPNRVACLSTVAAHVFVEETMPVGIYAIQQTYQTDVEFREKLQRVHGDKTESVFWGWCSSWMNERNLTWDMRSELSKITCPTLVIQGIDDEHASPQHAREIAEAINNAELWLVPAAEHMLPQDYPDLFNQRVLEFLNREFIPCSTKS